jgi:outer membrane protein assembly factor BamD (BamD/ComL family)/TM2 domain-containing membrane protein YozV
MLKLRFILRRCGVHPSTPHSSIFARLACGAFYEAVELGRLSDFFMRSSILKCVRSRILSLFVITALCLSLVIAQEALAGQEDRDKLFGFAEALFTEGDYYRAITEYKRFKYLYPIDILVEKSDLRIGECYFKAGRRAEAIDSFNAFIRQYFAGDLRSDALYLKGQAEKEQKRYTDALTTFEELIRTGGANHRDRALYAQALVLLAQRKWQKAREAFATLPQESPLYPSAKLYSDGLGHMDGLPRKAPVLAGTLAAVLPGAGHLYAERPRDAIVSFLLNGSLIWAAVELFRNNNNVAGGIVAFFELGWYSGNIYSAVGSAHKYNKRIEDEFLQGLKDKSGLSLYRDRTGLHYIMYSMMF